MPDGILRDGSLCPDHLVHDRYGRPTEDKGLKPPRPAWKNGQAFGSLTDLRSPTDKDKDRALYSDYFKRLAGVTQVVSPHPHGSLFHNRLIHSQKVASLARGIALNQLRKSADDSGLRDKILFWGGLDASATEAAALMHDAGHPPFGHVAENVLDRWLKNGAEDEEGSDGFEGNAQSFRDVAYLERKSVGSLGLEFTAVSLAAVLKYPWLRVHGDEKKDEKFGSFRMESGVYDKARAWTSKANLPDDCQTLEASIMDLADDITYAVHDLQDFLYADIIRLDSTRSVLNKLGAYMGEVIHARADKREPSKPAAEIVPFVEKMWRLEKFYPGTFDFGEYRTAIDAAIGRLEDLVSDSGSSQPHAQMRSAGAQLIELFVSKIVIDDPAENSTLGSQPRIHLDKGSWHLAQVLKDITKVFVVETPRLGLHQEAQIESLDGLLAGLLRWVDREHDSSLPRSLEMLLARRANGGTPTRDQKHRAIVDYCCGLTDEQAHRMSLHLRGLDMPSVYA